MNSPRHVIWLDPGKTTGVAHLDRETNVFVSSEMNFIDTCRYLMGEVIRLNSLEPGSVLLGAESFVITANTAKNSQAPWSLELIGVSRMVSTLYLGRDLAMSSPSQAKRFSSDERLKSMGFFKKGKGHANDAARHLLHCIATRNMLSQEKLKEFTELF